jgi:hypothetical protein
MPRWFILRRVCCCGRDGERAIAHVSPGPARCARSRPSRCPIRRLCSYPPPALSPVSSWTAPSAQRHTLLALSLRGPYAQRGDTIRTGARQRGISCDGHRRRVLRDGRTMRGAGGNGSQSTSAPNLAGGSGHVAQCRRYFDSEAAVKLGRRRARVGRGRRGPPAVGPVGVKEPFGPFCVDLGYPAKIAQCY